MSSPFPPSGRARFTGTHRRRRVLAGAVFVLTLAGCAGNGSDPRPAPDLSAAPLLPPTQHVHALAIDADRPGAVLMATHEGLFVVTPEGHERVGPVIDLMGFSVVGPGRYVASGHPGAGVDMPDPVGLIESTDAGRTWTARSRAGESDFHAVAGWGAGVLAVGRGLERTDDLETWSTLDRAPDVFDVSTPDGRDVIVTNENGPQRSLDGGATWSELAGAPVLQLVEHSRPGVAAGVTPEGVVYVTEDGGGSWIRVGDLDASPRGLAVTSGSGTASIVVLTDSGLFELADGDEEFVPWG